MRPDFARCRRQGFTLVEMLIVLTIIGLLSVVLLPVVFNGLEERETSDATLIVQAVIAGARDSAIKANRPQGLRLVPDPTLYNDGITAPLAANRIVSLETPPDHSDGQVFALQYDFVAESAPGVPYIIRRLAMVEYKYSYIPDSSSSPPFAPIPNSPTQWYNAIRQGDRLRFGQAGAEFTIAGPNHRFAAPGATQAALALNPALVTNPERLINQNFSGTASLTASDAIVSLPILPASATPTRNDYEILFVTNGRDDNGNGYVDESFDGIDNNGDGLIDPGFNGLDDDNANGVDDPLELFLYYPNGYPNGPATYQYGNANPLNEYEAEQMLGTAAISTFVSPAPFVPLFPQYVVAFPLPGATTITPSKYTIVRRPVVNSRGRDIALSAGVVIDLTTTPYGLTSERSRVPIDRTTGFVDLVIYPNGQILPSTPYANSPDLSNYPFLHLWLTDREGIAAPTGTVFPRLAMPEGAVGYTGVPLKGQRRLISINTRTGDVFVNLLEAANYSINGIPFATFNATDVNGPYREAELGRRSTE